MYHWIDDKDFSQRMRNLCSGIVNQLVQLINNEGSLNVEAYMVGSGAKNLETQNANEPIDLDYNLSINKIIEKGIDINRDANKIKEYIRKKFNEVLNKNNWSDCQDSTSCLSTEKRHFTRGNNTEFNIDLAIVCDGSNGSWYRLIHEKTGYMQNDRYYWNEAPSSKDLKKKVDKIKKMNLWNDVRDCYLDKKNLYLYRRDYNHPSFNCYIEAVNEVFKKIR